MFIVSKSGAKIHGLTLLPWIYAWAKHVVKISGSYCRLDMQLLHILNMDI